MAVHNWDNCWDAWVEAASHSPVSAIVSDSGYASKAPHDQEQTGSDLTKDPCHDRPKNRDQDQAIAAKTMNGIGQLPHPPMCLCWHSEAAPPYDDSES